MINDVIQVVASGAGLISSGYWLPMLNGMSHSSEVDFHELPPYYFCIGMNGRNNPHYLLAAANRAILQ